MSGIKEEMLRELTEIGRIQERQRKRIGELQQEKDEHAALLEQLRTRIEKLIVKESSKKSVSYPEPTDVSIPVGAQPLSKLTKKEVDERVEQIYVAFGTGTGCLMGLKSHQKDIARSIIMAFLRLEGRW